MKNPFKFIAITSLLTVGAFSALASGAIPPTETVQSISIQLTAVSTGASTTAKDGTVTTPVVGQSISTKDVIKALGGSSAAQLLLVSKIQYTTNVIYHTNHSTVTSNTVIVGRASNGSVVLQDHGNLTTVSNITVSTLSTNVSVVASKVSGAGLLEAQESFRIDTFSFTSTALSFQVGGLDVKTLGVQSKGGVTILDSTSSA